MQADGLFLHPLASFAEVWHCSDSSSALMFLFSSEPRHQRSCWCTGMAFRAEGGLADGDQFKKGPVAQCPKNTKYAFKEKY